MASNKGGGTAAEGKGGRVYVGEEATDTSQVACKITGDSTHLPCEPCGQRSPGGGAD